MTLQQFFEDFNLLGIYCSNREQAHILLFNFAKLGKRWRSGSAYTQKNDWQYAYDKTIYYNRGTMNAFQERNSFARCIPFEEISGLEKVITKEEFISDNNLKWAVELA